MKLLLYQHHIPWLRHHTGGIEDLRCKGKNLTCVAATNYHEISTILSGIQKIFLEVYLEFQCAHGAADQADMEGLTL